MGEQEKQIKDTVERAAVVMGQGERRGLGRTEGGRLW